MAVGKEAAILDALMWKLSQFTSTPAVAIAWPNVDFTPSGPYVRASLLPARTEQLELGLGLNRHSGIFQLSVFWPVNQGEVAPMEIASALIAYFKRGSEITHSGATVRVLRAPWTSPALQEPGWLQIPVNVPYFADLANPS